MSSKRPVTWALVAVTLSLALAATSCSDIQEPEVVLSGVELRGLSDKGIEFILLAEVTNPNTFGASIGRLEYSVEVDGTRVAEGLRAGSVPVGAGETVEVDIPFALTWKGLEKGLSEYFDGGEHRWRLRGSARLTKGGLSRVFSFSESGAFRGPDAGKLDLDL
ncbi:MAG: hypothetical protein GF400_02715 [Candidatus Eisenbacteria bacterium]|nr:hypothetical protein [Candidatus Eisenbacteria bacterium]